MATENTFYTEFDEATWPSPRKTRDTVRNPFQVDRDRLLFSDPFRRLQSKTQVFQSGEYDFYRTRLTHTIETARIARSIAEYLNAQSPLLEPGFQLDADLVEGVALAHDLGHPPFGHIGERTLHRLMQDFGGFEGNAQTLRLVSKRFYEREDRPKGMTPTRAFLDGILKYRELYKDRCQAHASEQKGPPGNHFLYDDQVEERAFVLGLDSTAPLPSPSWTEARSIECQIMDWADDTAYSLHDIVDGVRAGFLDPVNLQRWGEGASLHDTTARMLEDLIASISENRYEPRVSARVGDYIAACELETSESSPLAVKTARHRFHLRINPEMEAECQLHKRIALELIFKSPSIQQIEFKGDHLLSELFEGLRGHIESPKGDGLRLLPFPIMKWVEKAPDELTRMRELCDYLSSLTDGQALRLYRRLFTADFGPLTDYI